MTLHEHDLIVRARKLEESALAAIFDTYYEPIYRYIYYAVGHRQAAEDIAAAVFHRMLRSLHCGSGPHDHLRAWLYRTARNLVIDDRRKQNHRGHADIDVLPILMEAPDMDGKIDQDALSSTVRKCLQELSHTQQEVLVLRYLVGLDVKETADVMQTTVGAVKVNQHRALRSLRQKLEEVQTTNEA